MRLLIIEDTSSLLEISEIFFKEYGFDVDTATNGVMGVDLFIKNSYDVVIIDVRLPYLNGDKVAERIRGIDDKVLLIGVTAWGNKYRKKMLNAGCNLFFTKPFSHQTITLKILDHFHTLAIRDLDTEHTDNLLEEISELQTYLHVVKMKIASQGSSAPASLLVEKTRIEDKINELQQEVTNG